MGERHESQQDRLFTDSIERIIQRAIPKDRYYEVVSASPEVQNSVTFKHDDLDEATYLVFTKEKFAGLLCTLQRMFPGNISQEWVDESVKHETEHLDEARKIYGKFGELVTYRYALTCLRESNGNVNFVPRYEVRFYGVKSFGVKPEIEESKQVREAPKNKSVSDLISLGDETNGMDETLLH